MPPFPDPPSPTDPEPTALLVSTDARGITTITLNRPHVRNAVNRALAHKLVAALAAFDAAPSQRVAILAGAGGAFCAGFDLHEAARLGASSASPSRQPWARAAPMGPSRLRLAKPLVAAIHGPALAGGLELALLADLRVCSAHASTVLGAPCRRWGVPLIDGGTVRLPRVVGLGRALDLVLTGRAVGAREALGMGLVNRVVGEMEEGGREGGELVLEEAGRLAGMLVAFPRECMLADRRSVYHGVFEAGTWEDAMRFEFEEGQKVLSEGLEGAKRFSEGEGRHGSFAGGEAGKAKL
ncbi:ClpP/crotonase-like domain-containing protein [Lineolata rhizophorae]|uniref:ClpP/crotonase-like domain-containing protein n=1 Tax=Lineolata rhizophorae TaxID=578093 RepID=A0A6A6NPV0_9PEZI|nr:ClpP/crotonase-like domain-containing protein [Lineolata rhizophorae]